jgi:hypothetical protein
VTSFEPSVPLTGGQVPQTVVSADVDLDGFLDLAVANNESNDVTVLYAATARSRRREATRRTPVRRRFRSPT